jgi:hypothetical protein
MFRIYGCGYSTRSFLWVSQAFQDFIDNGPIDNWRSMKIMCYRSATETYVSDWEESLEKYCMRQKCYLDLILNELDETILPNWIKEGF